MTNELKATEMHLTPEGAHPWFQECLNFGFELATSVDRALDSRGGRYFTIVPSGISPANIHFPQYPDIPGDVADAGLAQFLKELTSSGAMCVVAEDDLMRKGDSEANMQVPTAFLGDRVIHWTDLQPVNIGRAVRAIKECASHVLYAHAVSRPSSQLGLMPGKDVPDGLPSQIAKSLVATIAFAFDGTSFAVWELRGRGEHDASKL